MGTRQVKAVLRGVVVAVLVSDGTAAALPHRVAASVQADSVPQVSRAERLAWGRAYLGNLVARYGAVQDSTLDRTLREVLQRLQSGSGHPELQLSHAVINIQAVNAFALPGGCVVLTAGLVRFFGDAARRDAPGDTSRQRVLSTAYLASVLAHELAHETLGHVDEVVERARRLVDSSGGGPTTDPRAYERVLRIDDFANLDSLQNLRHSREAETEADRAGALYLLRAGWTIEDMTAGLREIDALERRDPAFDSVGSMTYLRSHPRASEREARLDIWRGELRLHQKHFDDAVSLINDNVQLDLAIALLDSVLVDFPNLLAARHARATAYARAWLATVPIQSLRVRASLPTYASHFRPGIRGGPEDSVLLRRALSDFSYVLAREESPLTLSNAAALEAYAGDAVRAERSARRAVELLPESLAVVNNLGVVLFLAGRYEDARAQFELAVAGAPDPAYLFNLGRTLLELHDSTAGAMLRRFLASTDLTQWRREAAVLLGEAPVAPQPLGHGGAGARPPPIAGLTFGASAGEVVAALGRSTRIERGNSGAVWHYDARGLICIVNDLFGLIAIEMTARGAGALDGVAVGDATSLARARWGAPTVEQGPQWFFQRAGDWGVVLQWVGDTITRLGIAAVR